MLKRLLGLTLALLLLAACTPTAPSAGTGSSATAGSSPLPPLTTQTPTAYPTIPPEERGQVRLYTCNSELYDIYTRLAADYTKVSGVEVSVILGQGDCREALQAAMDGENAPTIFCLHGAEDLNYWQEALYDMTGSAVVSQLSSLAFAQKLDDKILAVAADVQGYGLIYNASLLAKAGFTRSDIKDFAYLELVCQRISTKKPGFSAFSALDFSDPGHYGNGCMLSGISADAQELRSFLQLYLAHDKASTDPLSQFLTEKTLFYLGGTWDYDRVAALGDNKLDILPAFSVSGGSLRCNVSLAWGVNAHVGEKDIRQSLDFLRWLVVAGPDGSAPVDSLELLAPYRAASYYGNKLEEKLRDYMSAEPVSVDWNCCGYLSDDQLQALSSALSTYVKSTTDENWQKVESILSGN